MFFIFSISHEKNEKDNSNAKFKRKRGGGTTKVTFMNFDGPSKRDIPENLWRKKFKKKRVNPKHQNLMFFCTVVFCLK